MTRSNNRHLARETVLSEKPPTDQPCRHAGEENCESDQAHRALAARGEEGRRELPARRTVDGWMEYRRIEWIEYRINLQDVREFSKKNILEL